MVLKNKSPERLYERLTKPKEGGNEGERVLKTFSEEQIMKFKNSTSKTWSVRALRWLDKLPQEVKELDMSTEGGKQELKKLIKHRVGKYGDRILWGQPIEKTNKEKASEASRKKEMLKEWQKKKPRD